MFFPHTNTKLPKSAEEEKTTLKATASSQMYIYLHFFHIKWV